MFRQNKFAALLVALVITACSQTPINTTEDYQEPAYKNASWGMNQEQIKSIETIEPYFEEKDAILYRGPVNGTESIWFYEFNEKDQFKKLVLVIDEKLEDNNQYVNIFFNTASNISKDYGQPTIEDFYLNNEELRAKYSDTTDHWGEGIEKGHLEMKYGWEKDGVRVTLELMSDDPTETFDVSPNSDVLLSYQVVNMSY